MKRKVLAALGALVVALGLVAVSAAPAHASLAAPAVEAGGVVALGDPYGCGARLCWYEHTNYNGAMYAHSSASVNVCYNIGSAWNDRISSVVNGFTYRVKMWTNANCGGFAETFSAGWGYGVVLLNDQFTSWKLLPN